MKAKDFLKGALFGAAVIGGATAFLTSTKKGKQLVQKIAKEYVKKEKLGKEALKKVKKELDSKWLQLQKELSALKSKKAKK